ncbi:S9 family peptidase [Sphingobacterium thalpophilum]|uniref:Prolyl tripeptidyl peptidase n=1 Tax=Sphingobacterium thalpophilum TaxID=259 RepID=A0A4U9U7Q2_9SPHI|nr:S9 family peptidase [Sphingobacterium thalpophilum]VTR28970.1 Prolyl tripeptidyl peptidase precursor [Sphingobacterium thalpophilum]
MKLKLIAVLSFMLCQLAIMAQGTLEDYKRAKEIRETFAKIYGIPQQILWSEKGQSFSYRTTAKGGRSMLHIVDVVSQKKQATDVGEIEKQLTAELGSAVRLSGYWGRGTKVLNANEIEFVEQGISWTWNASAQKLTRTGKAKENDFDRRGGSYWGMRRDDSKGEAVDSPDKVYTAYIKNSNVYVSRKGDAKTEKQLTFDGSPGEYYMARIQWSADSKKIAVSKVRKAEVRQLTLLESSPVDQLQPKLQTRDYVKPGDALPQYYPAIIWVEDGKIFPVDPMRVANQFTLSELAWRPDNNSITFEYNQRGHQRYDIMALSAVDGKTSVVISETSPTFIDYSSKKYRHDLQETKEIIWASERDGWNHLYLFDGTTGKLKKQITKGQWVVRKVVHVDEAKRKIIFEASGMKEGEDPYLIRYYSIGLDGNGLKELTPELANHQATFNGDYSLFVDVYSTVNQAPTSVLRDAADGRILMELERTDISELESTGWKAPEVFSAVGRDGKTDIWGIIVRPRNFDPNKKYPVIEYIYAGPHSSFVPKSFSANPSGMYELAELGFVVVQIDGMGTSNRSKAFHDVAWKNLKDAGFPDRIAWIKAAASRYPYMDIQQVGIYGTSAGGQSSTAALLFHPDFYKVAVSSCGCHDNRMDKIWWNEQWMGWPIGPEYAACSNTENAYRLEGKLMLIVGELDDNVDPASTYQLVNQLIKHGKDHEFIMVPGMGHSSGGDFGEKKRRDFFVKHLLGVNPPAWNLY